MTIAIAGGLIWLILIAWQRPSVFVREWGEALLLLAPLLLVPLGLRLAARSDPPGMPARMWKGVAWLSLPAALLLACAFALPAGWRAAALALPWLATTGLIALIGLARLLRRRERTLPAVCIDAGLVYLAVGGGWAVLDRLGARPLGFEPVIVLLTAIHFHYAGFVLPLLTGLAGAVLGGRMARLAAAGVIVGVPLTAVGITATQLGLGPLAETGAAWLTAAAAMLVAWLHLRLAAGGAYPRPARILFAAAAVSLVFSMALAALYGGRTYLPVEWLDIPWMRATHGTANALGFALAGLAAWTLAAGRRTG